MRKKEMYFRNSKSCYLMIHMLQFIGQSVHNAMFFGLQGSIFPFFLFMA